MNNLFNFSFRTGYESEQMRKHKKDLQKQKAVKLDTWCSVKVNPGAPENASNDPDKSAEGDSFSKELNLEELSLNSTVVSSANFFFH